MHERLVVLGIGLAAAIALPPVPSGASAPSRAHAAAAGLFVNGACPLDGRYPSKIVALNTSVGSDDVTVTVYRSSGSMHSSATRTIHSLGAMTFDLPRRITGSVVVSSDESRIYAVMNRYRKTRPDSSGAGFECTPRFGFSGVSGPFHDPREAMTVVSAVSSPARARIVYTGAGGESRELRDQVFQPFARFETSPQKMGAGQLELPGTAAVLHTNAFRLVAAYTAYPGANMKEPPDYLGFVDSVEQGSSIVLPFPLRGGQQDSGTFVVQNLFSSTQKLEATVRDPQGNVLDSWKPKLEPLSAAESKPVAGANAGIGTVTVTGLGEPVAAATFYTPSGKGSQRASGGTAAWRGANAGRLIDSRYRGYGFGAASTRKSKVSVVLHNPGATAVEVTLRIYDAAGTLQTNTTTVPPRGTAVVPFGAKARGEDLVTEVEVMGSGSVYGWLMRDFRGDLDFFPVIPDSVG